MDYQVQLNNSQTITMKGASLDSASFTQTLNDNSVMFVDIGGAIINKHLISAIIPLVSETPVAE